MSSNVRVNPSSDNNDVKLMSGVGPTSRNHLGAGECGARPRIFAPVATLREGLLFCVHTNGTKFVHTAHYHVWAMIIVYKQ